jgi:hypothetical protein
MREDQVGRVEHDAKIEELRDDYTRRGYRVVADREQWPRFPTGFQPDLVVSSDTDNVVVEVKVRRHPQERFGLHALAEAVDAAPGWRLELVVVDASPAPAPISVDEARKKLEEARLVYNTSQAAGFLLAWSGIEALLRVLLLNAGISSERMSQLAMVKTATAEGLIPQDTADLLSNAVKLRNSVAHGIVGDESLLEPESFQAFLSEAQGLLARIGRPDNEETANPTVDRMVEWFFENYEDPANGVPYETAEGGYIYYLGGPYDAGDVLWEHFPDADGEAIEEAGRRILPGGFEWIKRGQYPGDGG